MRRTGPAAIAVLALLASAGCSAPWLPTSTAVGCSDVGSPEGVGVDLTAVLPFEGGDYHATITLPELDQKATTSFAGNDEYGLSTGVETDLDGDPVAVEVTVVTEAGAVAYRASSRLQPRLSQPDGARCDGENYRVDAQATADGRLVALPEGEVAEDAEGRVSLVVFTDRGVCSTSDGYASYARVGGALDDGAGGPPPGWNTPVQRGWAAIEDGTVTFEDELGHHEVFQRVAADDLPAICG